MPSLIGHVDPLQGMRLPVIVAPPDQCILGQPLPSSAISTEALLDTGTTVTCLTPDLVQRLSLPQSQTTRTFVGAMFTGEARVHYIDLILPFNGTAQAFTRIEVIEIGMNFGNINILLGLDIICRGVLVISHDRRFIFSI